jgi:hypothetical protein
MPGLRASRWRRRPDARRSNGFDVQGCGQIKSANTPVKAGFIISGGLTLTATSLRNSGILPAPNGGLTVNLGSLSNLVAGKLTRGNQGAISTGILQINAGDGLITSDAATISFDDTNSSFLVVANGTSSALQASLSQIAPGG